MSFVLLKLFSLHLLKGQALRQIYSLLPVPFLGTATALFHEDPLQGVVLLQELCCWENTLFAFPSFQDCIMKLQV